MEQQIKLEKERILNEEKARERQVREEMEKDLREKDRQMQELLLKHQEMEGRLSELNLTESETKHENEKLVKEKDKLEKMLHSSENSLQSSREHINDLKSKQRHEKRDRAMAALQISEGIALERESLVKQLEMLREMNRKLRDERDESDLRMGDRINGSAQCDTCDESDHVDRGDVLTGGSTHSPAHTPKFHRKDTKRRSGRLKDLGRKGSVMSDYFDDGVSSRGSSFRQESVEFEESGDISYLDAQHNVHSHAPADGPITAEQINEATPSNLESANSYASPLGGVFVNPSNYVTSTPDSTHRRATRDTSDSEQDDEYSRHIRSVTPHRDLSDSWDTARMRESPRKEPVGANSTTDAHTDAQPEEDLSNKSPERVFKVVFVGDSGVGKSSFIHRFCSNSFKHTFSATIGVDFQVKNMRVDSHLIALQLWDTAGQERFRSITKQYFRKADGVFIMYDVTSETSFKNIRNWMVSVQDGVEEGTVLAVVGNKIDLVEQSSARVVTSKDGAKLADEYEALYYETSARSGSYVRDSVQGVASLLCEREDRELEKTLNVSDETAKKKGCCD